MANTLSWLVVLLLTVVGAYGYRIQGKLITNNVIPDLTAVSPSTRVLVNGGRWYTWIHDDGSFQIDNVPEGNWLVEVESKDYVFPKIQLQIQSTASGDQPTILAMPLIPGQEWSSDGKVVKHPLELAAVAKMVFFTPREGFNLLGMLTSPYILMMGFTLVMLFVMPKLQANMDPESAEEWEEEKSRMQKQIGNLQAPDVAASLASWMTGSPGGSTSKPPSKRSSNKNK
ncbi:hypothetical protein IWQ62_005335 [Dispira parvispora]|uniref:ER membrane protein complex subunit 7 beta-sandwich domain-containing protein n=1 Tax=Dispira parvispora TaxID=1520584 RepID=A0A9W8AK74_9FUNG|nr:hypothetical protein IWQ62_005335 [Dispira parvispora]